MTKTEYWLSICNGIDENNVDERALYGYNYWKKNGVLPDNIIRLNKAGEATGNALGVLLSLWELVSSDRTFQTTVLDAYAKYYFDDYEKECDLWTEIKDTFTGLGPFKIVAPQLREIMRRAIKLDPRYQSTTDSDASGLLWLCLEYTELKYQAKGLSNDSCLTALFENADLLSLIRDPSLWGVREVGDTLVRFKTVRTRLDTERNSGVEDDIECFDKDIRPILVGRLMCEADSVASWQRVFLISLDMATKIYALKMMSKPEPDLHEIVDIYNDAKSIDLVEAAEAARILWMRECGKLDVEKLMGLQAELQLDKTYIQNLILSKCED